MASDHPTLVCKESLFCFKLYPIDLYVCLSRCLSSDMSHKQPGPWLPFLSHPHPDVQPLAGELWLTSKTGMWQGMGMS